MLAGRIGQLVHELLPNGRREGVEWRCGSVAGERGHSLSVHLGGHKAGIWADFATGEGGDALDLVAAVLFRGGKAAAIAWARRWLGIGDGPVPAAQRRQAAATRAADDADQDRRRALAQALWLAAAPRLAGTPADHYLAGRGIILAELGRQPRALRYHPALWCAEVGAKLPAMVAAITDGKGEHCATHRTWLARRDGVWTKAPLRDAKKSIGQVRGGSIRIWRGASARSLRDAPPGDTVAIAEGIETALSVAIIYPELRVLSAVSVGNMVSIALPPAIATVILVADNDGDNVGTAQALQRAVDRFAGEGRTVRIARSPVGGDMNDLLQAAE
jgi:hypothetical protein